MAIGPSPTISAGSGGRMRRPSAHSPTGRRIVMATGPGVRLTAGRGLDMNRGVGRRITTVVGFITMASGHGVREVSFTGTAVGGVRRSSRSYSTFHSATTFAGIRCRITRGIHVRVTTVTIAVTDVIIATTVMPVMIATIGRDMGDQVDVEIGVTMDHGAV